MKRYCHWHGDYDSHATPVAAIEIGDGPRVYVHACPACRLRYRLPALPSGQHDGEPPRGSNGLAK